VFERHRARREQGAYRQGNSQYGLRKQPCCQNLTPEQVAELMLKRPELRLADNPANVQLAQLLIATPEDQHLQELFQLIARDGLGKAIADEDEFLGNYPPKGSVVTTPELICCGHMPTGDPIVLEPERLFCNLGVFGRTGSGKTSWLYFLIKQILKTGFKC